MSEIRKNVMATVCGRPNVGKSSLTDRLVGEKVAIVSPKAQTTRDRICGVLERGETQIVLVDTPGLHRPRSALGEHMVRTVRESLSGPDCALLLVDPVARVGGPESALIARAREEGIPTILCVNKIDTVPPSALLPVMAAYRDAWDGFETILPISARTGEGLDLLLDEIVKYAVEGPWLFPEGQISDQPERQIMGELLREKLLLCLDQEIPHGIAVEIVRFSEDEGEDGAVRIEATIWCEKASHKGIVIGKGGAMLKRVGSLARRDMEASLGRKVVLKTWVKVREGWRQDARAVRSFGYRSDE